MKKSLLIGFLFIATGVYAQELTVQITRLINWNKDYNKSFGFLQSGFVTDSNGNKIVVGGFDGLDVDFGTDDTLSSDRNLDVFIVKYDSLDNLVFLKNIGGIFFQEGGYSNDYASDVKVDSENNIYVMATIDAGTLQKVDLDPEHPENNSVISTSHGNDFSIYNHNAYLIKYSPEGKLLWYREIKDDFIDRSFSLYIDTNNDVWATGYVGGFTGANIDFDTNNEYPDNRDIIQGEFYRLGFVARYNSDGGFIGVKGIGGGTFSNLHVCVAPTGNMYLAGSFSANITDRWQGLSLFKNDDVPVYIESQGYFEFTPQNTDVFILKCNALGNVEWVKTISSTLSNEVTDIALDDKEHVYISGYFSGNNVDFDNENNLSFDTKSSASNGSGFVAEYNTNGNLNVLNTIDGGARTRIQSLAVSNNGTIALGGHFEGNVKMGDFSFDSSSSTSNPFIAVIDSIGNWNNAKEIEKNSFASITNVEISANNDVQFVGFEATNYDEEYNIKSIFYGNAESEIFETPTPDVSDKKNIIVYPNPSSDIVNIETDKNVEKIAIYDLNGKLIMTKKDSNWIGVRFLPDGVYIIRLHLDNNEDYIKLILVR
ncbi:T9SS type A sorting domain-containing protein [Croceivirga radicis]|uniref:T9SS type A sorting domain-containing protein n=1 Tax=Croceivirga radicis TaxID=1929488 RepID=UPI000255B283|nr:T9SS type A sorting domain-containing protein [Croceivirga radicis]